MWSCRNPPRVPSLRAPSAPQALALIPADQRPQVVHQSGAKQIDALLASAPEVKSFEVSELLDQHPESGDYSLDYFELLRLALDDIVEGARP